MIRLITVGPRLLVYALFALIHSPALAVAADGEGGSPAAGAIADSAAGMMDGAKDPTIASDPRREATEEIEVVGERRSSPILMQPQSISIVTREDAQRNTGLFLDESLNLLPGVRVESRTLSGGQRITIRGYGNNTNFNGTGYKAYLNGIPLTDAEGTTILDDVDVSTLEKVEVIRGPASSLYGAGIGGVLRMYTLRPEPRTTRFVQELIGGGLSLFRSNTRIEYGADQSSVLANYGHQHSDGYRIHSQSRKDYALLSADFQASAKQSLSVYAAYNHSFEQLAGQLTEKQFLGKENFAEAGYLVNDAHVAIDSVRVGVAQRLEFHTGISNVTSAYASGYQLDQPFAGGRSDNLVFNYGARTELELNFGEPTVGVAGVFGGEVQRTNAFKKSYNLVDGELRQIRGDLQVVSFVASAFTQWDLRMPYEFILTGGASLNFVHYNIQDRLAPSASPGHLDQSGIKDFTPVVTPRAALLKAFNRDISVYAQVSLGYSPPGSSAVVIPQIGAANKDLKPERGIMYEVGTKGNLIEGRLLYELALFDMFVKDKLTPQTITDGPGSPYVITTNAGSQNDRGVELAAKYAVVRDSDAPLSLVQPFVTYTFSNFRYDNFRSNNNDSVNPVNFSGKKVVGVPAHVLNLGLDLALKWGFYVYSTYQYVDSMPLTFDNAHTAKSYSLLSAKVGYRKDLTEHFRIDGFAGGDNLLGSLYYMMVFLNASYTGPSPNVYLPGPYTPVFYGGVNLTYTL
jgi:iron complex outermembrane receptor protein